MALLYMNGFEGYATAAEMPFSGVANPCRITAIGDTSNTMINSTVYRTTQPTSASSRSLQINAGISKGAIDLVIPASTELIVGFAIRFYNGSLNGSFISIGATNSRTASNGVVLTYDGSTGFIAAHINSLGNPGTLLGTATGTYSFNVWYYVELRIKVGAATGELQIKIDETEVLNLSNINTATGSLTNYTGLSVYSTSNTRPYFYFDDFYLCDTTGALNNTFLGAISVFSLLPNGAGSSTELAAVGAASNWQAVNEVPPNTTTYVETSVTGQKDYYSFEDLPAGITVVNGATIRARSTTITSGGRKVKLLMKNGANIISSTLRNLTIGNWIDDFMLSETAPDGSAWTKAAVDATECGVEAQ